MRTLLYLLFLGCLGLLLFCVELVRWPFCRLQFVLFSAGRGDLPSPPSMDIWLPRTGRGQILNGCERPAQTWGFFDSDASGDPRRVLPHSEVSPGGVTWASAHAPIAVQPRSQTSCHIDKYGEDTPEIRNWKWGNPKW